MGCSPSFKLFVGIPFNGDYDEKIDEILSRLPIQCFWYNKREEGLTCIKKDMTPFTNGLFLEVFESGDESVGFGVEIFSMTWDSGTEEFPLLDLNSISIEIKYNLRIFLESLGIFDEIKLLSVSDYS